MRTLLAMALLMLCIGVGAAKQGRMRRRAAVLGALERDILALRDAMELSPGRLADHIRALNAPELAEFWGRFAERLALREPVESLWRALVEKEKEAGVFTSLRGEDSAVLLRVGEALSLPGREAQLARLNLHARELGQQKAAAEAELSKKGKMVSSLGALIGLALALMVI